MKTKLIFSIGVIVALLAMVLGGCTTTQAGLGNIEVRITDAPNPAVSSVEVTFTSVEIHQVDNSSQEQEQEQEVNQETTANSESNQNQNNNPGKGKGKDQSNNSQDTESTTTVEATATEDDSSDNSGWIVLMDEEETFDLLDYQGGLEKLLTSVEDLPAGRYNQIRFNVSKVMVTYEDPVTKEDNTTEAKMPSGKLKIINNFEIVAGETTVLVYDFDAMKSLNFTGNDKIICKPVIKLKEVKKEVKEPKADTLNISSLIPDGKVGEPYVVNLKATGGKAPYTWSIEGNLPDELHLSASGDRIVGTPTEDGNFTFTITVRDSSDPAKSASHEYTINIEP